VVAVWSDKYLELPASRVPAGRGERGAWSALPAGLPAGRLSGFIWAQFCISHPR